jgi:hypothetical protein
MNGIGWKPGEYVTEPGCYPSIPLDVYHGQITETLSVSHSLREKAWSLSPAHMWNHCPYNPDHEPVEPTEPMILGRAAHHLFLGERNFTKHFVARPSRLAGYAWNSNRTEHREWLTKQEGLRLTVLKPEQVKAITGMGRALAKEPMIQQGLLSGRIEQSLIHRDPDTGIWIKSRPDAVPNDSGDFVDIKVVADISDEGLARAIGERGYHRQGATILEAAHHTLGYDLKIAGPGEDGMSFTLVFIEAKRPHCVEIITLKPDDLKRAIDENHLTNKLIKRCLDEGDWPGPSGRQSDARYLGVREWNRRADEYRAAQIKMLLSVAVQTPMEETQA